jgi:Delta14-sterol reductase
MTSAPPSDFVRRLNMVAFVLLMVGLPIWVWYCLIAVNHYDGALVWPGAEFWSHVEPPSLEGFLFYMGWLALQATLYHFLPGKPEEGQPLPDGSRLTYRLNGLLSFVISIGLWAGLHLSGVMPGDFIYRNLPTILGTANLVVMALCFYVYFLGRSQATEEEKALNALEAFFVGAARNPRNGRFDWKFFCESRPGLTFWVIIAFSCAMHQYETFGHVTNAMWLVCFAIFLYIVDYYIHEDAILTTWDIIHEPFGWMLCWGSLVYVPFFYPLAAIWLAAHDYSLPMWAAVGILVLNVLGYVIFRQCNIQKHHFRKDPSTKIWGKPATFIQTKRGTKLLTSGWWGVASHANYLGDLMMSLAMGLTVGPNTFFGYGYFFAFVILLIHRDWRDDRHCAAKYGDDWKAYRAKVRWHIVPGLY